MTAYLTVLAAVVSGALGWTFPAMLARIPEPDEAADDKPSYWALANARGLRPVLALSSAVIVCLLGTRINAAALLVWTFFVPFGVLLSYVDWHTRLLPKKLVIPGTYTVIVLGAISALVMTDLGVFISGAISAASVFAIFFVMWLIYPRGLGYGDVRLSGALGLALGVLGVTHVVVGIYASFVIGALAAIAFGVLRIVNARQFAFGPYLFAGAIVGAGWGPQIAALI